MTKSSRVKSLDSLRGIAALVVLFRHCYCVWPESMRDQLAWLNDTPLRIFINSHAAVTVFFVLSGYVLALPFWSGRHYSYWQFVVRRFCRIYIPFAVSILLALLLYFLSGGEPNLNGSGWFNGKWDHGFSFQSVMAHFLMIGRVQDMDLNHNMWTLVHEMRIAVIYPLLIMLCANSWRAIFFAVVTFVMFTALLLMQGSQSDPFFMESFSLYGTFFISGRSAVFFILGILLAKHKVALIDKFKEWGQEVFICMWGVCVVILIAPRFPLEDVLHALVAALAIMLIQVQPRLGAWLASGVTAWLGRVSYSLYLVHLPILFALFHLYLGKLPFGMIAGLGVVTSLGAAEIMYRLVERPAIALGRRLTAAPVKPSPLAHDVHGRVVTVGARVRLLKLSGKWFDDMASDEKQEVLSMVGEVFEVETVNEYGHAEICKWWQDEVNKTSHSHTIDLEPHEMELIQDTL